MKSLCAVLLALLCGCSSLRESTHAATALDASTTVIGVTSGLAVEANPLVGSPAVFVGLMLSRVLATEYVNSMAEPQRTTYLSAMSSFWWGAGVSNLAILLLASNPAGLIAGAATGLALWARGADERLFAEICAAERVARPALVCEWNQ
jgi:hypothetical protein